jgi:hypothetical protein
MSGERTIPYEEAVRQARLACRQFAMLYFHFAETLVNELGLEKAKPLIQRAIFQLALDRSDRLRARAEDLGLPATPEGMWQASDLPKIAWDKSRGRAHCPYAEAWVEYYAEYPWFKEIAPLYCDVIDTTNIENFSKGISHRITANVLTGDASCEREYFSSQAVKEGRLSYGSRD